MSIGSGITYFFFKGGVVTAEGGVASALAYERFGSAIASGEAMAISINVGDRSAPLFSVYADASFLTNFEQAAIAQNWNVATREVFGSTLGFLAGAAAVAAAPEAIVGISGSIAISVGAVLLDQVVSNAFSSSYDLIQNYYRNNDPNTYRSDAFDQAVLGLYESLGSLPKKGPVCDPKLQTSLRACFSTAGATTSLDPLALDLNGDGRIGTTGLSAETHFDLDANGFAENVGWICAEDGLLVRDLNGSGSIDSGRELFGDQTLLANGTFAINGFTALAALDTNADGVINSTDAAWSELKVWNDAGADGISGTGELRTLFDAALVRRIGVDTVLADPRWQHLTAKHLSR